MPTIQVPPLPSHCYSLAQALELKIVAEAHSSCRFGDGIKKGIVPRPPNIKKMRLQQAKSAVITEYLVSDPAVER